MILRAFRQLFFDGVWRFTFFLNEHSGPLFSQPALSNSHHFPQWLSTVSTEKRPQLVALGCVARERNNDSYSREMRYSQCSTWYCCTALFTLLLEDKLVSLCLLLLYTQLKHVLLRISQTTILTTTQQTRTLTQKCKVHHWQVLTTVFCAQSFFTTNSKRF